MISFNLAKKSNKERFEVEMDKAAALTIYKLRHLKSINQRDIQAQIAELPVDQQDYFCQRPNHHELTEHKV